MKALKSSRYSVCCTGPHRERGAALIEFTLILPILVILLVGGTLFGLVMITQQAVTHAAESGAAAVLAADPTQSDESFLIQSQSLAQTRVNERLAFLPGAATATVQEVTDILDASDNVVAAGTQYKVTVTYPFSNWNLPSHYLPLPDQIVGVGIGTTQ